MAESLRFYVDPSPNSADPEVRMTYGLHVVSPWGGTVFINFPEHLEYMPGTKGIARHHDERDNVWRVEEKGARAHYSVESLTDPGVFFHAEARADGERAHLAFSIRNETLTPRRSLRAMFCHDYGGLAGFPGPETDNFARTFVPVEGRLASVADLPVRTPSARARMAQAAGCPDHHNWWAEQMGGLIEAPLDFAFAAVRSGDDRHVALSWTPGKCLLSNCAIPCIHADPYFGDLPPDGECSATGTLVFGRGPVDDLADEFRSRAQRPWLTPVG